METLGRRPLWKRWQRWWWWELGRRTPNVFRNDTALFKLLISHSCDFPFDRNKIDHDTYLIRGRDLLRSAALFLCYRLLGIFRFLLGIVLQWRHYRIRVRTERAVHMLNMQLLPCWVIIVQNTLSNDSGKSSSIYFIRFRFHNCNFRVYFPGRKKQSRSLSNHLRSAPWSNRFFLYRIFFLIEPFRFDSVWVTKCHWRRTCIVRTWRPS